MDVVEFLFLYVDIFMIIYLKLNFDYINILNFFLGIFN